MFDALGSSGDEGRREEAEDVRGITPWGGSSRGNIHTER